MKVKLVGYTQPAAEFKDLFKDALELVAYCTKVSNPSKQNELATSDHLIRRLIEWKHWSPLEMASITMEVETTRDIARQFLRHRSFAFQEFSQRYANPNDLEDTFVLREARWQDKKNRQNSVDFDLNKAFDKDISRDWIYKQQAVIDAAKDAYDWAIANGIAKEQARVVLPEGNTVSKLYAQGSIRSWIHYIELRSGNGTQKEHMELARAIGYAIATIFPMTEDFIHD